VAAGSIVLGFSSNHFVHDTIDKAMMAMMIVDINVFFFMILYFLG
jgi:hypothetical protein